MKAEEYEQALFYHHLDARDILRTQRKLNLSSTGAWNPKEQMTENKLLDKIDRWHRRDERLIKEAKAQRERGKLRAVK